MTEALLNPAFVFFLGALLVPVLGRSLLRPYLLLVPIAGLVLLCTIPQGVYGQLELFGLEMATLRLDRLSFIFGVIFHLAAAIAALYAWHLNDRLQQSATLIYAGAAIGALLAGDLITLFLYWEITAISSVFLIWARKTERAYKVGLRYLIIQVLSGVLLLGGAVIHSTQTGSIAFDRFELDGVASWMILLSFGIKCAFPLLHNWLQDAYPESTVTGTVVLSVFTTKLAVYALARGFPGTELLIWVGAVMTAFPIFFAVIENDLRRVLAYSLNNQLGFMVCGIGIGTELAINGAAAHAFAHILYKALLFMSMGAVLYRVGTIKASELGGLYKSMPWTATFCIVGAMSISAFPLMSGFVTKSMILLAAAEEHLWLVWLILLFASAGVLDHSGIKIPFFSFFAHDSGKRCAEAPLNMLLAMGIAAFLCIGIGVYPDPLYALLPYAVEFVPYTTTHVLTQMQLLMFAAAAFAFLFGKGWYPPEIPSLNLDFDWTYRRALPAVVRASMGVLVSTRDGILLPARDSLTSMLRQLSGPLSPKGLIGAGWSTGAMVWWVAALMGAYLLLSLM
ncbi:MAG: Na(+)/H(+) antiporter subunit D [Panacagrimonas sp.]